MRASLAVAGTELRRFLRDRSNIFFSLVFPLMLVLIIGMQFGDDASARRAIVVGSESELRTDLVAGLEDAGVVVRLTDRDTALEQLARGRSDVGLLLDDEAVAAHGTGDVRIRAVLGPQATAPLVQQQVTTVLAALRAEQAQLVVLTQQGLSRTAARAAVEEASAVMEPPTLVVRSVDERMERFTSGMGQFDFGASGQLLLFTFLSSLTGSATLIQARRLGVVARTLAAPVSSLQLIGGQVLGRFAIAFFQGGYIMAASSLLFGVDWGNLGLSLLVLLLFALVSAGAAMVVGSLLDNEGAAAGVGIGLGLVLAALGGSMTPLEFFPDTMRTVANLTPHAWAYEAFADIQRRDADLVDVLPQLGVLAAMAAVLVLLGSLLLRRSLARAM